MADKPRGVVVDAIDWESAFAACQVIVNKHVQPLLKLPEVLAAAMEASHWLEASKQDRERAAKDLATAQAAAQVARDRQKAAEVAQAGAENAARAALAEAARTEDECATRIKQAEGRQAARLAELDAEADALTRKHATAHAARVKELETEIGRRQATLAEVTGQLEALRSRL